MKLLHLQATFDAHPLDKWLVGMGMIVPFTALNVFGVKPVGRTAILFGIALLTPFAVLVAFGLPGAGASSGCRRLALSPGEYRPRGGVRDRSHDRDVELSRLGLPVHDRGG